MRALSAVVFALAVLGAAAEPRPDHHPISEGMASNMLGIPPDAKVANNEIFLSNTPPNPCNIGPSWCAQPVHRATLGAPQRVSTTTACICMDNGATVPSPQP